ncbi:hypothetical protein LUTEI9C_30019 [Luteimonas sp. 9C]|nr:hypothetical protein LUTEI9C_30019 [Luteimonas sp. 9C]
MRKRWVPKLARPASARNRTCYRRIAAVYPAVCTSLRAKLASSQTASALIRDHGAAPAHPSASAKTCHG